MSNVSSSSVFLVSGGARGITAQCMIRVAERYHCKFILLGRSSIAEPEPAWAVGRTDEGDLKKQIIADLTGRGEKPTPVMVQKALDGVLARREIEATVRAIAQAGGQAEYVSADITDASSLREKVSAAS